MKTMTLTHAAFGTVTIRRHGKYTASVSAGGKTAKRNTWRIENRGLERPSFELAVMSAFHDIFPCGDSTTRTMDVEFLEKAVPEVARFGCQVLKISKLEAELRLSSGDASPAHTARLVNKIVSP